MAVKILITGSDGQLGRELRSLAYKYNSLSFIFTDLGDLDITNTVQLRSFINKHKPDFLVNCAGYTAVDRAEEEPDIAMKLNADAVQNIVDAIAN
ncbi:MAG: sugar nucleotide-binding protein, partial [Bacteroidales bacterium]|nr:sugar nucleotide-binding protein [Bacteroidales bacterium]